MAVWGGLKIAEKRKEAKGKGDKKRYIHLNAEFQRIPRRDKEAFFSDQCKEIEENNRMGKTRDLFKKIRDIKGTFHAKMDTVKDRNGIDRTEAEDIKKRWQEYISSVQFSRLVVSDTLRPHESQYARPPCPSPTPSIHPDSHPSSQWYHPAISSSVVPFSSCPQSLPASASFPMSQLFAWGGQSTGVSALASFLPKKSQGWSPLEWTGWIFTITHFSVGILIQWKDRT